MTRWEHMRLAPLVFCLGCHGAVAPAPLGPPPPSAAPLVSADPRSPSLPTLIVDGARCRDSEQAARSCTKACWDGDETACSALMQACEEGDPRACVFAASRLENGPEPQPARLMRFLETACAGGEIYGCIRLEFAHRYGAHGQAVDPARAEDHAARSFAISRAGCEASRWDGCISLGNAYRDGWGTASDPVAARAAYARGISLMMRGCDEGEGLLCHQLGIHHRDGNAVPRDPALARRYLTRACALPWEGQAIVCRMVDEEKNAPVIAAP